MNSICIYGTYRLGNNNGAQSDANMHMIVSEISQISQK